MEITQQLISLDNREDWDEALSLVPHAFGHTWESCAAMHKTSGYPTYLYLFRQREAAVVCPIAERSYNGFVDIVTPYGFSGFVSNQQFPGFSSHWLQFAKERGYVCGYIGMNPLFESNVLVNGSETSSNNEIFLLDLTLSEDQLLKNLSSNRKRELKTNNHDDCQIVVSKDRLRDYFISHYHSFFSTRQHSRAYDLDIETLGLLIDSEKVYLNGIASNNEIKAVAMFAHTPYCGEYLFYISEEKKYTSMLIWDAAKWLKKINIPYLNLGGGVTRGDSIAEFKRRFGGMSFPLNALKQVYNTEVYARLCDESTMPGGGVGYFPAYRAGNLQST